VITKLLVSAIVCVKNGEALVGDCLESIRGNSPAEIVVLDGKSTDRTQEIAQRFTNKIYISDKGLGYLRQLGAEKATEDHIVYVDSDVIMPKGTIETMFDELKTNGYAGIHAQIQTIATTNYWEWARQEDLNLQYNKPGKTLRDIPMMTSLWRKDIILKYKFDPFFVGGAEHSDLCRRVTADGYKLGSSSAFIYHRHRATLSTFVRQRYWHGQGMSRFIWKYKFFWGVANLAFPVEPLHLARCLLKGKLRLLPYVFVCDSAYWAGMALEFARLSRKHLSREELTG
jgi:glycosyltransferase involved in cell wall biosynthesis